MFLLSIFLNHFRYVWRWMTDFTFIKLDGKWLICNFLIGWFHYGDLKLYFMSATRVGRSWVWFSPDSLSLDLWRKNSTLWWKLWSMNISLRLLKTLSFEHFHTNLGLFTKYITHFSKFLNTHLPLVMQNYICSVDLRIKNLLSLRFDLPPTHLICVMYFVNDPFETAT